MPVSNTIASVAHGARPEYCLAGLAGERTGPNCGVCRCLSCGRLRVWHSHLKKRSSACLQCNPVPLWLLQAAALGSMQGDLQACIQKLAAQQAATQDAQSARRAAEQQSKELEEATQKLEREVQQVGLQCAAEHMSCRSGLTGAGGAARGCGVPACAFARC